MRQCFGGSVGSHVDMILETAVPKMAEAVGSAEGSAFDHRGNHP